MNYKNPALLLFAIFFLVLFPFLHSPKIDASKPTIVCTTSIIADAVKQIVGDTYTIISLMGPGIDPHLYRAKESDIHKLAQAKIIFYNGLHLEGRMAHILEKMNSYTTAIAVSNALGPHERMASPDFPTNYDPHIWLDVALWMRVIRYITQVLCTHDPQHTAMYEHNAHICLEELQTLDAYVRRRIAQIPENARILVTAHDAFGYFGKAYGVRVVGLQGMSTQTETGLYDIAALVDFIVEHKIRALFTESSIPTQSINAVQQAALARSWHVAMGPTLYTDALGTQESGAETYVGMIRHNVDGIVKSLAK